MSGPAVRRSEVVPSEVVPTDAGSVLVLMLGFAVLAVLLVAVVTDASSLYLTRRSLAGSADGAALTAVQELDRVAFYTGPSGEAIPLDPEAAAGAVQDYVTRAGLVERYEAFVVTRVDVGPESVTVSFRCLRRLPFPGIVGGASGAVLVDATATARAPYVD